ncbi:hypothetical protein CBE37_03570 [bacterium TMED277]|nr:MAG: hypothetical protein CBE37_03570 [bacterium TMED277]
MRMDVVELQNFYSHTDLGKKIAKIINKTLNPLMSSNSCEFIIGFGFTCPFMEPFIRMSSLKVNSPKIITLMPGEQGVIPWPKNKKNVSVLVDETSWPINTSSADIILVAHGLEVSRNQDDLLNEAFRVLDGKGKLILLVPNRTGFWARSDNTPFGFGKPYTINQLTFLLSQNQFNIDNIFPVLYGVPSKKGYWLRSINFWEAVGKKFNFPFFGGVLIVEASKSVYGAHKISTKKTKKFSNYGKATITT